MGRKKLKLITPTDVHTETKNYLRRLPCLIKKCKEISEKTCTKVFLMVTDEAWSKPVVYCSEYLDCFFASYEKAQESLVEYGCDFKNDFEIEFCQNEIKRPNCPFSPYSFQKSYVPMARRVTKGEFFRRNNVYPENEEEIADGIPIDMPNEYITERMEEQRTFKPRQILPTMHNTQFEQEKLKKEVQEHKFEIFKDILF